MADGDADQGGGQSARVARGSVNTLKPPHIPARILWPALGFPAVIAPGGSSNAHDASTCISVVLLSTLPTITSEQAAEHLRFVPWEQRRTRYLLPGTSNGFTKEEIEVRSSHVRFGESVKKGGISDDLAFKISFGYDSSGSYGFSAALSKHVLKLYDGVGYSYLHEVRVSRAGSSRLAAGKYNLFWISSNPDDTENNISNEMDLLIKTHATTTRKNLKTTLPMSFLLKEYEYDFDAQHDPYSQGISAKRRTEVLHPLFVQQDILYIQIGHITDLHVDVRSDVYEDRLKYAQQRGHIEWEVNGKKVKIKDVDFNNWNRAVEKLYRQAKDGCDVLLLTGDLIDYGRGHVGIPSNDMLGDDSMYHVDRNWFLFYYILASGNSYEKPTYTILGNHDWRLNPYPPFAIVGSPSTRTLINNYAQYKPPWAEEDAEDWMEAEKNAQKKLNERLRKIIEVAHGQGADKAFSYLLEATSIGGLGLEDPVEFFKTFGDLVSNTQSMDFENSPAETAIESVAWYLLLINPFLDYAFHLPGGYAVLMLDWAQEENVLFPIVNQGKEWGYMPWEADEAAMPGPKAKNCLTGLQKHLVQEFLANTSAAKVLGVHAPPISPYPTWPNDDLLLGSMKHRDRDKTQHYESVYKDEQGNEHVYDFDVFYAVRPRDAPYGWEANFGSLEVSRDWLINALRENVGVRLVLSGHIHRAGLFVVYAREGEPGSSALAGVLRIKLVTPSMVNDAKWPAVAHTIGGERGPLYVNTTSAGPRGHLYQYWNHNAEMRNDLYVDSGYTVIVMARDGTIKKVEFRTAKGATAQNAATSPASG